MQINAKDDKMLTWGQLLLLGPVIFLLLIIFFFVVGQGTIQQVNKTLVGRCFDLPPMKRAEIQGVLELTHDRVVETIQTDISGAKSVVFVPLEFVKDRVKPCNS